MRHEYHCRVILGLSTPSEMAAVMEGDEYVNELGLQVVIEFALCYEGESIK